MDALTILKTARRVYDGLEWTQFHLAVTPTSISTVPATDPDAIAVCATGAICRGAGVPSWCTTGDTPFRMTAEQRHTVRPAMLEAERFLVRAMNDIDPFNFEYFMVAPGLVSDWNDAAGRTKDEVLAAFDRAIILCVPAGPED